VLTNALAVLAACANGLCSVLKRKANKHFRQREDLSPHLVRSLLLSGADSPSEDDSNHHEHAPASASEAA
jgi:hypothetical protein